MHILTHTVKVANGFKVAQWYIMRNIKPSVYVTRQVTHKSEVTPK